MKNYSTENIINLALTGHASTGKTMLAEAMVTNAGMIQKMGSITNGTTISDYREYEIENQHSISLTLMNLEWEDEVKRIKKKDRKLHYNEAINVYKRRRTFDGIRCLSKWLIIKDHINLKRKLNCLEVGSHEGQSSTFFLNYILLNPKSKLLCCDPWLKSHWIKNDPLGICYEDIFNYNMKKNDKHKQVKKFRGYNHDLYEKKWFHID